MSENFKRNVSELCRLCAAKINVLIGINIFEGDEGVRQINNKINTCLPIQVLETDSLPKMICAECDYRLELCFAFRKKSVQTQSLLISLITNRLEKPEMILGTTDPNNISHDLNPIAINADPLRLLQLEQEEMELNAESHFANINNMRRHLMSGHFEEVMIQGSQSNCNRQKTIIKVENEADGNRTVQSSYNAQYESENSNSSNFHIKIETPEEHSENDPEIFVYENHNSINAHLKNVRNMQDENCKRACQECGKSYNTDSKLAEHMRRHLGEQYKCNTCNETFWTKTILSQHEATHADVFMSADVTIESNEDTVQGLPIKSKEKYEKEFHIFNDWRKTRNICGANEDIILAYFHEIGKTSKASSLWTRYSMLKSTLKLYENVDMSKFSTLLSYLKAKGQVHKPKISKALEKKHIEQFLVKAPDNQYLLMKVALIMGISGACRCEELTNLCVDDIEDKGSHLLVTLKDSKINRIRKFVVLNEGFSVNILDIYKKYAFLRPRHVNHRRFFLNYKKEKCTIQPVGKNTLSKVPKEIATYLRLPEAELYSGHSFRRSAILLAAGDEGRKPWLTPAEKMRAYRQRQRERQFTEDSLISQSVQLNNRPTTSFELSTTIKKPRLTSAEKISSDHQRERQSAINLSDLEVSQDSESSDSKEWYMKPVISIDSTTSTVLT